MSHASGTFQARVGSNATARSTSGKEEQHKENEEACKEKEEGA